jgi:DNA invertase Pin-like site-specific DNA recombinase
VPTERAARANKPMLGGWIRHIVDARREIDRYLHQQAVDISTPSGRMLFGMLGVFSEFERAMIRSERPHAAVHEQQGASDVGGIGIGLRQST